MHDHDDDHNSQCLDQKDCVIEERCFLRRSHFAQDLFASAEAYPGPNTLGVMDLLDTEELTILREWMTPGRSEAVCIARYEENSTSQWTTDITLELMGVVSALDNNFNSTGDGHSARLAYFFGQHEHECGRHEETMVRDCLVQLHDTHPEIFSRHQICQLGCPAATGTDCTATTSPCKLWRMLERCVIDTKIRSLVVMLDNIDVIFENDGPSAFDAFTENLRRFVGFLSVERVIIKVVATTRLPKAVYQTPLGHIQLTVPHSRRLPEWS